MHSHASDARLTESGSAKLFIKSNGDTVIQNWGKVSETDMRTIQRYIKKNYIIMFEKWSQYSVHGFYGDNQ